MNDSERGEQRSDHGSLARRGAAGERRPGLRAAGRVAVSIAAPILARHGGLLARLKAEWSATVGAEFAAICWPYSLGRDGALRLRVAPGFALDVQHRASIAIERINLYFGRPAISRLTLVQGPLPLPAPPPPAPSPALNQADSRHIEARLAGIADPALRTALAGLGQLVLARRGPG